MGQVYREAVMTLHLYLHNILSRPEEPMFKKIKQENANFKVDGSSSSSSSSSRRRRRRRRRTQ